MDAPLVIIPTYNESANVAAIARAVLEAVPAADVLFVDDNSPDGTGDLAEALGRDNPRIHVLHKENKQGLGRAYVAGFQWALERDYDAVFEMDADFSHDPAALPDFLKALRDADLVLGTRYRGGVRVLNWPLERLLLSMSAARYVRLITGMPFSDPTGGFKCFRRAVLETIDLDTIHSNGYAFQIEMTHTAWRLGFRIAEVPITFEERRSGDSKMNTAILREALWRVWALWIRAGGRRRAPTGAHPRSVASLR